MRATGEPPREYRMGYLLCSAMSALCVCGAMYVSKAKYSGGKFECEKRVFHCECGVCVT